MSNKLKCSVCNDREASHKGMCSGCYAKDWRARRKVEREVEAAAPKQLTSGVVDAELEVIEGEVVHDTSVVPETHLTALNPAEMQAAQSNAKAWLEQKLTVLERDIVEANAALNEARRNGWATGALTSARNRAVDDETYFNKILAAIEAGHTIIPEFPVEVFAVRREKPDQQQQITFNGAVAARDTMLAEPVRPDCAPAGVGEYRNPQPTTRDWIRENLTPGAKERNEPRYYTTVVRYAHPAAPISFPPATARSPVMRATAKAMKDKVFDQIGVCLPVGRAGSGRAAVRSASRHGDPLVIGQVLRKNEGGRQKCVSFIIAWYLDLNTL